MSAQSPELINKINNWRLLASQDKLSIEEMREAIKHLRQDRNSAEKQVGKAKAPARSVDSMLKGLGI